MMQESPTCRLCAPAECPTIVTDASLGKALCAWAIRLSITLKE